MAEQAVARISEIPEGGMKPAEIAGTKVVLIRLGGVVHALEGECPHQGGPLHEGAVCDGRVVCPWHMGTFDIASGTLVEPPPMRALARYSVRLDGETVLVDPTPLPRPDFARRSASDNRCFVLIGSGAAAAMAATSLREFGFTGRIVMIGADPDEPLDRTLLSKQGMSGEMALNEVVVGAGYQPDRLDLERETAEVTAVDADPRRVTLSDGRTIGYDAALVATGGQPRMLDVPGHDLPGVFTLRHRADLERILAVAQKGTQAVLIGTSFIAMEAAASLIHRGVKVTAAGPDKLPFARQFGPEVAGALKRLHEKNGVVFHLGAEIARIEGQAKAAAVVLKSGERLPADFVLIGIGVRPATDVVRGVQRNEGGGIIVDRTLRAAEGLYAAGDVAAFPGADGTRLRIEHWRVAEQQGRVAARNMLGQREEWTRVPFFWTQHYDKIVSYVGHATDWDRIAIDGDVDAFDFLAFFVTGNTVAAVTSAGRDRHTAMLAELMRNPADLSTLRARLGLG